MGITCTYFHTFPQNALRTSVFGLKDSVIKPTLAEYLQNDVLKANGNYNLKVTFKDKLSLRTDGWGATDSTELGINTIQEVKQEIDLMLHCINFLLAPLMFPFFQAPTLI